MKMYINPPPIHHNQADFDFFDWIGGGFLDLFPKKSRKKQVIICYNFLIIECLLSGFGNRIF